MFLTPISERTAKQSVEQFRAHHARTATLSGNRANRAATISTTAEMVETTDDPDVYLVHSESNSLGMYTVNVREKTCTCPDHGRQAAHGIICKHRLAVAFLLDLIRPQPKPTPAPTQIQSIEKLESERYNLANQLCILSDQIKMFPHLYRTEENKQRILDLLHKLEAIEAKITGAQTTKEQDPYSESFRPKKVEIIL